MVYPEGLPGLVESRCHFRNPGDRVDMTIHIAPEFATVNLRGRGVDYKWTKIVF